MRINIHHKITLIFGIIIAVILFGVYFYLNVSLQEDTRQRIRDNVLKQISLTKTFLEDETIQKIKGYDLDEIADDIGRDLDLRITIIDLDGTVYGDSELDKKDIINVENHLQREEVQQALKIKFGESRRFSTTIKKDMLYIAALYGKEKPPGIVRLSIPLHEVEQISGRLKKTLAVTLLFAFVLSIFLSFLVSGFISKPVRNMSLAAQDIAQGDFSRRVPVMSNDEIGDLSKAFNFMAEQVKVRIEEVMTSKSRLEAVLLSMFEGVMVIDSRGTILLMNKTLKNLLHVKEEPVGRKPLEIIRNIEVQEMVDKALKLKQGVESREISVLLPKEKVLLVHATPVIRSGVAEGAVLVFHDLTHLKHLERIRQDFVANVSHELRTPVSSIKGYAETLLEGALEDKEIALDFLKIIYSDSDQLARLIDDLLNLSKIESGKLKMNIKSCSILSITERVVSGLLRQAKNKSVEIIMDISKNISNILADEARIAQVLLNLLDNAIKYNRQGGKITITAEEADAFIQVNISDTGIGIP
ncbi:MAG: histidine kinase dimerization/phospho-acceptor domain-containing protein, partial [Candidatus Omnitrophota bacterium]